jgi:hypothetical protein
MKEKSSKSLLLHHSNMLQLKSSYKIMPSTVIGVTKELNENQVWI